MTTVAPLSLAAFLLLMLAAAPPAVSGSKTSCVSCESDNYTLQDAQKYLGSSLNATKRENTIFCLFTLIDADRDQHITKQEFDSFVDSELYWPERKIATWDRLKSRCSCTCGDDGVSLRDTLYSYHTCLYIPFLVNGAWKRLCTHLDSLV